MEFASSSRVRASASAHRSGTRNRICASTPSRRCVRRDSWRNGTRLGGDPAPVPLFDLMTQRARRRHRRSRGSIRRKILLTFGALLLVIVLAGGAVAAWVYSVAEGVNINHLKPIRQGATSRVFAADGTLLGFIQSDTLREPVESSKIPKLLKDATVAIEDQNFYEHGGIDPEAIMRALVEDVKAG